MKRLFIPTLILVTFLGCKGSQEAVNEPAPSIFEFWSTINEEGLRADLTYLASDELNGRDTGSEGLDTAAVFLANRYATLGLEPVGDDGTYFQHMDLSYSTFGSISYTVTNTDGEVVDESTISKGGIGSFYTLMGGETELEGDLVFAGYGISNDEVNHFPEQVEGKWILTFYERGLSNFGAVRGLMRSGASGVILIMGTDVTDFEEQAVEVASEFGEPGGLSLAYLQDNSESDEEPSPAVSRIHPELAMELLGVESIDALTELGEKIKSEPAGFEPYNLDFSMSHDPEVIDGISKSKNVVAFLEGSDPELKDEVVVLSAHYDHVGVGRPDSTGDAIYNGADDDGSGTVGVLHAAQALVAAKKAGAGPKRSVLFLHVTGEEKGLLGSRYYSDHPIYEVENTVANLNVDMIGRRDYEHPEDPNYVYVIGGSIISSGLDSLMNDANAMSVNITLSDRYNDLEDPNQFYRRSDHWNFGRLGVPFVFFFNGVHDDYHRPSDEVDKIDFEALTKRTQLIYMTTANVANTAERPEVDNQEFIEKTRQQPR
jgi:hypothetical protein